MTKNLDRPQKVRTTLEELEVLANLKDTVQWAIVKRIAQRYINRIKSASFKLTEENPKYLAARHAEFAGQALGIKMLIRMIDNSGKKLEEVENE
jgi:Holliday junction resolvasome RuvABC ATP-dependent DNA helicase subunit